MREIFVSREQDNLFGYIDLPAKSFTDLLLFSHGLLSGVKESQRYAILRSCLHKHGIATAGFYYPGHGPRKTDKFSIHECVSTFEKALEYVKNMCLNKKITVAGTSLGSTIISLISPAHQQCLKGAVLFSVVLDPAMFLTYKFEQKHYDRWRSYGYTTECAEEMFRALALEGSEKDVHSRIVANLANYAAPKIFIHGLNDKVTTVHDITAILDQNSTLLVFSGDEGTHDIKGLSLECACRHTADWIKLS